MKKLLLAIVALATFVGNTAAQRYLQPVFSGNSKSTEIYAYNYTVLQVPVTGRTARQPLVADIYQPNGDTASARPLVVYLHTGNFLPQQVRQTAGGLLNDSCIVEMARRMTARGYVFASADYRLGWNPIAQTQEERTNTLINAAYRGVQDVRTAIRYFKANASRLKIDTNRIILWGQGTGGYISLAASSLDSFTEVYTTTSPAGKFFGSNGLPMVISAAPGWGFIAGDVEGKFTGRVPPGGSGTPPQGDTLNLGNYPANTSNFQMCVNMGGAIGDISWIGPNNPPIVSIQAPHDIYAPYNSAVLRVPINATTSLPVVEVQGALAVSRRLDSLNINTQFSRLLPSYNPYKSDFQARNGGTYLNGLFPFYGDTITDSSPWDFYSANDPYYQTAFAGNPRMSQAKSNRMIDSIMTFVLPRACIALNLPCKGAVTSTEEVLSANAYKLTVAPNPAQTNVVFESEVYNPIQSIELFDISGRQVHAIRNINTNQYSLDRNGLPAGMYVAKVKFEGGILTKKLVFND